MSSFLSFGRPRRGFTLLEIIVVVVIMGIVGTMSAGRIHALIVQQRAALAANSIQNDIELAFTTASRNRRPVLIAFNSGSRHMEITDQAGVRRYRRLPIGMLGTVTFSRSPVEVYPTGLANDTLLITLTIESVTKRVRMSRAGLVQVLHDQ
jgi:prepilin-type N-terminal cleavage/methylation domain-containing protein